VVAFRLPQQRSQEGTVLYLDAALELEGLTIFRDYNAPSRFFYMPRSPRLTMEAGQPMFSS
jgi:hypothetical protein